MCFDFLFLLYNFRESSSWTSFSSSDSEGISTHDEGREGKLLFCYF